MKQSNKSKAAILVGLFYPLYALPWIFKGMIRNEKWAFIMFSFFMGLFAI